MSDFVNVISKKQTIKANITNTPSATPETKGVIRIATKEEALAGIDNTTAITPFTMNLAGGQNYGAYLEMSLDTETYVLTVILKNINGDILSTQTVDFPSEYAIRSIEYDESTKSLIFTLENGTTFQTEITGLQSEITNNNKLSSDLIDDTNKSNKFVTVNQKELLDGITANASEINILDGITSSTEELNQLHESGVVKTDLEKLHDLTATATELNYTDGVTSNIQDQLNSKVDKLVNKPTAGTYTKVTITNEGLVSSGDTLTANDIPALTLSKISDVTATAEEINILDGATVTTTELNYVDGVTSSIQTQLNDKEPTITGAATSVVSSDLTASRVIISDSNGKIAVSDITTTELNYLDSITANVQTQINGKQATISLENMLSSDFVDDSEHTHKFATASQLTQITTNANDIITINSKIPSSATTTNQLADEDFVNSSIATNTANFIGTFESVTDLQSYTGTVTNNDYSFVANGVITDNGNDWATFNDLDAYDKTLLTNFDYAWVINGANFDLYRFDILEQTWGLRVSNTQKASVTLNTAYNRYKATVTNNVVSWGFEYTLNNSSFTSVQWAAINSGANTVNIAQISTNTNDIAGINSIIGGYGNIVTYNVSSFATSTQGAKADSAIQTVVTGSANGTIAVDGTNVSVYGLGSAAYTASSNYATSIQGGKADTAIQTVKVNGSALTPDSSKAVDVTVPTKISDLTDNTSTYPVDKADTLTNLTATISELNILDGVTATATELNVLDGITASTTELNYVDGVTSAIQTQLNAKQTTANLVTSVSSLSTDSQYPSAKLFYDTVGNLETLLHTINSGSN